MSFINKSTREKIDSTIRNFIQEKLEDGFTDRRYRKVEEVIEINLRDWSIDESKSDRNNLYISGIESLPSTWVRNRDNGLAKVNFDIAINENLHFTFNAETEEYELRNGEEIRIFDRS